jgi:hypothetical protein
MNIDILHRQLNTRIVRHPGEYPKGLRRRDPEFQDNGVLVFTCQCNSTGQCAGLYIAQRETLVYGSNEAFEGKLTCCF